MMKIPAGFRVEPIAGEPEVAQPIAYSIDDRGRLWVVENTNYPNCPGEAKDRVLVLESTKNDSEKRPLYRGRIKRNATRDAERTTADIRLDAIIHLTVVLLAAIQRDMIADLPVPRVLGRG